MYRVSFGDDAMKKMEFCSKENEKVREWCKANNFSSEPFEILGKEYPSHFYDRGNVTVEAASTTPFESIICKVKIGDADYEPMHSFEEFEILMKSIFE